MGAVCRGSLHGEVCTGVRLEPLLLSGSEQHEVLLFGSI